MSIVDKNALELCLQIGGERFGKPVFPSLQFKLPKIIYKRHYSPLDGRAYHDYIFNLLSDGVRADFKTVDEFKYKKHGVLLSGGVDSSLLTWLLNNNDVKLDCYTNSFSGRDETDHAEFYADHLGLPIHIVPALAEDQAKIFKQSTEVFCPAPSLPHGYLMFEEMKKQGVDVAWSGLGLDELFGGYTIHKRYYNQSSLKFLPAILPFSSKWRRALTHLFGTEDARFKDWTMPFRNSKFVVDSSLNYNDIYSQYDNTMWMNIFDWNMDALIYNYVEQTRQIASYFGIQVMFPYLYQPLVSFGLSLSSEDAYNKKIIRKLMRKLEIPERICQRGEAWDKFGWGDPLHFLWANNEYRDAVITAMDYDSGILNRKWFDKHISNPKDWQKRVLIQMALFELMCERKEIKE